MNSLGCNQYLYYLFAIATCIKLLIYIRAILNINILCMNNNIFYIVPNTTLVYFANIKKMLLNVRVLIK